MSARLLTLDLSVPARRAEPGTGADAYSLRYARALPARLTAGVRRHWSGGRWPRRSPWDCDFQGES